MFAPPALQGPGGDSQAVQVLIVDSEQDVAESLRSLFAIDVPRTAIACAATAQEALDALRLAPPDVVLASHRLPGLDGLSFLATVQQRCPGARCWLVAGWLDPPSLRRAQELRVGVLAQPFDIATLRRLVAVAA